MQVQTTGSTRIKNIEKKNRLGLTAGIKSFYDAVGIKDYLLGLLSPIVLFLKNNYWLKTLVEFHILNPTQNM